MTKKGGIKIIGQNKKARREYELLDFIEAGIVLTGSEVKSLRAGRVGFKDGHVRFERGEAYLVGVHIAPYENAGYAQHDPERPRKLLLHKREIKNLMGKIEQKGLTIIPVKMYFKNGKVKVELALAKGRKLYDQREELKKRAIARDTARELAKYK
ncbi:SsrA-binding protein SmpB [Desulfohalobiaceae bacterium Ax17]|uniref:SsrA-binding protein SmpB n=1 Tax=Desulfovulcanus ferrireducens TaxID=2831190 RepID=UPI00207BAE2E|nr:SsrA-binding protein SmpB [Desulfovulcanus ferrireducens]MBT8764224.1 SsrA-binding protein SmpB [Desulfovulcanus ferrireducens]